MNNNIEIEPTKQYQWNQNWANKIAHTNIELVISELNDIYETRGEVTPTLVVESAKNKKSVLHNYFEWDDNTAANKWRLRQASKLLGCIEIKTISNGESKIFRVYQTTLKRIGEGDTSYQRFDIDSPNIPYIKALCLQHLSSVQKRLHATSLYPTALYHIDKAIEELQKEPEIISIEPPQAIHLNGLQKLLAEKV